MAKFSINEMNFFPNFKLKNHLLLWGSLCIPGIWGERTLYRVLEILGANRDEIISDIQDILFSRYDFEHTNINMDWTSIVLHGTEARLGKYGYSRDHRPDKKTDYRWCYRTFRSDQYIPIGMTIEPGNLNDQTHFKKTYHQSSNRLREGSLVIF